MANRSGNAYALTTLCPIINGNDGHSSYDKITRKNIQELKEDEHSLFARVPNTYFARLFILNDVFFEQGNDVKRDHLKSKYMVFTSNFYGDLNTYLSGMWHNAEADVRKIWQYAVAFDQVNNAEDFIAYIKKCQLTTSLFFNGSTDDELKLQLKSLYVKQAFSEFVLHNQHKSPAELRTAFGQFINTIELDNPDDKTWAPAQSQLSTIF